MKAPETPSRHLRAYVAVCHAVLAAPGTTIEDIARDTGEHLSFLKECLSDLQNNLLIRKAGHSVTLVQYGHEAGHTGFRPSVIKRPNPERLPMHSLVPHPYLVSDMKKAIARPDAHWSLSLKLETIIRDRMQD